MFNDIFENKVNYLENNSYRIDRIDSNQEIVYTGYKDKNNKISDYNLDVNIPYINIQNEVIKGFNDTIECAKKLSKLLIGLKANINLIIYNPNDKDNFEKPDKDDVQKFKYILEQSGKKVTIRLERGSDIDAACGQLSNKYI